MRKGDIVVNPWVSTYFNGELNPNYATIYLGDNKSLDYNGRVCEWADKIYKDNPERETPWKVIGHIDLYGIAELAIRDAVFAEEIADTPQTDYPTEWCENCELWRNNNCKGVAVCKRNIEMLKELNKLYEEADTPQTEGASR